MFHMENRHPGWKNPSRLSYVKIVVCGWIWGACNPVATHFIYADQMRRAHLFLCPSAFTRSILVHVALLAASANAPALADIYSFTDARGIVHLSDVRDDSRYELCLRTPASVAEHSRTSAKPSVSSHRTLSPIVAIAAQTTRVDAALLHAVIAVESGYRPRAVSSKGAMGLMQLMPGTARRYGVTDPFDPTQNVVAGARYLRDLLDAYGENLPLALAAYNAGEKAVDRYGGQVPPYPETRTYVPKVMALYDRFLKAK